MPAPSPPCSPARSPGVPASQGVPVSHGPTLHPECEPRVRAMRATRPIVAVYSPFPRGARRERTRGAPLVARLSSSMTAERYFQSLLLTPNPSVYLYLLLIAFWIFFQANCREEDLGSQIFSETVSETYKNTRAHRHAPLPNAHSSVQPTPTPASRRGPPPTANDHHNHHRQQRHHAHGAFRPLPHLRLRPHLAVLATLPPEEAILRRGPVPSGRPHGQPLRPVRPRR